MTEQGHLFATAFLVGYALPNMTKSQSAHQQSKFFPPHKLSVNEVYFTKRKIRLKSKDKLPDYALSLLAGLLHPDYVVLNLQTKEELQWDLKLHKPIKFRLLFRRSSIIICKYHCSLVEFGHLKSAGIVSSIEKVSAGLHAETGISCYTNTQAMSTVERGSSIAVNAFKANECRMATGSLPSRSPDEIQGYIRKKNQLRSKEKKAAIVQAQAAMAARKEKMKVLEMERRARLRKS